MNIQRRGSIFKSPSSPGKRVPWIIAAVVIFLGFTFSNGLIKLATDFLWFRELGLSTIFSTTLWTKIGCGAICGVFAWLFMLANITIAESISKNSQRFASPQSAQLMQLLQLVPVLKTVLILGTLLLAFMLGSWATSFWQTFLTYRHAVPFGVNDPLFHKDIAFYVFRLPFYRAAYGYTTAVIILTFIATAFVYLMRQNVSFDGRRILIGSKVRTHLLIIAGLFCVLLGLYFHLKIFSLVHAAGTIVSGADYAQIHISIPILKTMRIISICAALLVWAMIFTRTYKLLALAAGLIIGGVLLDKAITQTVQKFIVAPDELVKETPYINWSIANTRAAFGLDKIEARHFVPDDKVDAGALVRNQATIDNIRLWDQAPLLTTYSQLQEIRTYYEFLDVDNDRYQIGGRYRQVMLSPRELVPASLPSRIWINERLTYTHGYGLCVGPVNSVTAEGLPDFFIKNIPPASTIDLTVTRPEIYFGEADAGYVFVKTGAKEFDYPSGNENVYTTYNGTGGIRVGGILKKTLFAMRFGELKILLRNDIGPDSRILFNRQILQRITAAIPFLQYDDDPYMVITANGRLVWIVDAYTTTGAYPYSATVKGVGNYIRNSVKAVIDAYDGSIALYMTDGTDPLIKTFDRVFPGVFKPMSAMPQDIRNHIRYPQTMFSVQAQVYAVYHMTDPQVFYNKEDVWRIPDSYTEGQTGPMNPYYTIMKLAEVGKKEEFILMVPFCPSKKENMIAWFAARCDQPDYGSLLVFDFPKQKLVYGPSQIESRINQDPEISKLLTLWNQGGSRVIRGSLLVIPVDQSLIYVQPLYLASQSGGVPELKRVIVAYENSIAMEPTLGASLQVIFGIAKPTALVADGATVTPTAETPRPDGAESVNALIVEANRQFELGRQELNRGNWAGYGEAMNRVKQALADLEKRAK
jgi:uncharacterized membrane protein (UPF0182 family)